MITEDQYWLAQPPAVRALRNMSTNDPGRGILAAQLAKQGFAIDAAIMVNGWSADVVMRVRVADGITWVPRVGMQNIQPYLVGAQQPNPPYAPYDPAHPPAGAIMVSDDPKDYPAFDPPPPQVPQPPATNMVGAFMFSDANGKKYYDRGPASMKDSKTPGVVDGQVVEQDGSSYTAHVVQSMMGLEVFFTA
ncbi:MAG TPA: hypothetical protein VJQ59_16810 [Candidatus Sulfotelmatobacter sp.]|nr:hypothetical protein [Candidatus Sulfotelmatobacter sp.]